MTPTRRFTVLCAALSLTGCFVDIAGDPDDALSFDVTVTGVRSGGAPADAALACVIEHTPQDDALDQANVPVEERGTPGCPYALSRDFITFDVEVQALNPDGTAATDVNRPVALRVVPGDLQTQYSHRQLMLSDGEGSISIDARHVLGEVHVWVDDGPPEPLFTNGVEDPYPHQPPEDESWLWTGGSSASGPIYFRHPTLAELQLPDEGEDNRGSPFTGKFVSVGVPPSQGDPILRHECIDAETGLQRQAKMVVTGTEQSGFYVTDVNACPVPEDPDNSVAENGPEEDGNNPGTFASMYVFNFNQPEGLERGDVLYQLEGGVTEFTSSTQLQFPSWVESSERVDVDAVVPVHDIDLRRCALRASPYLTDVFCGYSNSNLKLESIESTLVRINRVRLPTEYRHCDFNGNGSMPCISSFNNQWSQCGGTANEDTPELSCYLDCITSTDESFLCTERSSYLTYGQITVELPPPGPPGVVGFDASMTPFLDENEELVDGRPQVVELAGPGTVNTTTAYPSAETAVTVYCDADAHVAFGGAGVVVDPLDEETHVVDAGVPLITQMPSGQTYAGFALRNGATEGTCYLADRPRSRILTSLTVLPELDLQCDLDDDDLEAAAECARIHAARYDIVGHLRQVQPARPRWQVLPRDGDDICCHPGEGLTCPAAVQACGGT